MFAVALFFAGMSIKRRGAGTRKALLVVGCIIFLGTAAWVVSMSGSPERHAAIRSGRVHSGAPCRRGSISWTRSPRPLDRRSDVREDVIVTGLLQKTSLPGDL